MSLSPKLETTTTATSSQLATLLSDSCRESESLRRDLASTTKRAEKAERLLASLTQASTSNSSISDSAVRTILECESRVERAELARDDADARRRLLVDNWAHLERYLASLEMHSADARQGFSRIIADATGHLVLAPVPAISQYSMPPPPPPARASSLHRAPQPFPPNLPLPPLPAYPQSRARPRPGSPDQPPTKKPRSGREGREDRAMFSESPIDPHHLHFPRASPFPAAYSPHPHPYPPRKDYEPERDPFLHQRSRLAPPHGAPRRLKRTHSHTRSPSRSSSRSSASSLSVDEMLLQATAGTDDADRRLHPNGLSNGAPSPADPSPPPTARLPNPVHHRHRPTEPAYPRPRPDSPPEDYRAQRPRSSAAPAPMSGPGVSAPAPDTAGPLAQPGQVQTYQTHVFQPVVTGPPVKKSKFMNASAGAVGPPAALPPAPNGGTSASAEAAPAPTTFPAQNEHGQRICRQCGLPGRYKEGKCVEKWGPGPHGPGTVCDRCRKKMKRVERRGTADHLAHGHALALAARPPPAPFRGPVHRADTLPAPHPQLGPGGTHLLPPAPYSEPRPAKSARAAVWSPPPTIVTLDDRAPVDAALLHAAPSRSGSRNGRAPESGGKRSPRSDAGRAPEEGDAEGDVDADADAEMDGEAEGEGGGGGEADADAELLEAVDAAEAHSAGSGGGGAGWPKKEDV